MLVERIKKGSISAYKELFADYYPILCCFAENFLSDKELCKDVSQEALLKYWEGKENFDNIRQVKSFLYVVTKNMCLNLIKKQSNRADIHETDRLAVDYDINSTIIQHETMLLVRKAVDALPSRMRMIIELSLMGMQNSDIAQRLDIAEGTVHSLKKKAYKKLKESLGTHFYFLIIL